MLLLFVPPYFCRFVVLTLGSIILRHLFTHTGGWIGDFFIDTGRGDDALQRYVTRAKELCQEVPLGEAFVYNNVGLGIASYVLQEVGGKSYEQLVKEMLLDPWVWR